MTGATAAVCGNAAPFGNAQMPTPEVGAASRYSLTTNPDASLVCTETASAFLYRHAVEAFGRPLSAPNVIV